MVPFKGYNENELSVLGVMLFDASKEELNKSHAAIQKLAGWGLLLKKNFHLHKMPLLMKLLMDVVYYVGKLVLNVGEN